MVWLYMKCDKFIIKSLYSSLSNERWRCFPLALCGIHGFPWGFFFAWEAIWERKFPLDQLRMRDWKMLSWCYLCKGKEMAHYVPLHCLKVVILWQLVNALFEVQWVMLSLIRDFLLSKHRSFVGKKRKKSWRASLLCLF